METEEVHDLKGIIEFIMKNYKITKTTNEDLEEEISEHIESWMEQAKMQHDPTLDSLYPVTLNAIDSNNLEVLFPGGIGSLIFSLEGYNDNLGGKKSKKQKKSRKQKKSKKQKKSTKKRSTKRRRHTK